MILKNYFTNKIVATTLTVLVLLTVILSFIQLSEIMKDAVNGSVPNAYIGSLFLAYLPFLLLLLLPLTAILSGIVVINNFIDSGEFVAYRSLGINYFKLHGWVFKIASFLFIAAIIISFFVEPYAAKHRDDLTSNVDTLSIVSGFSAKEFYPIYGTDGVAFIGDINSDGVFLKDIFFARGLFSKNHKFIGWDIMTAKDAKKVNDKEFAHSWVLSNAHRYQFSPGRKSGFEVKADDLKIKVFEQVTTDNNISYEEMSLLDLWSHFNVNSAAAVLTWRFAVPISLLVMVLFVMPIAVNDFFQGIFLKMFFAITLYATYYALVVRLRYYVSIGKLNFLKAIIIPPMVFLLVLVTYYVVDYFFSKNSSGAR